MNREQNGRQVVAVINTSRLRLGKVEGEKRKWGLRDKGEKIEMLCPNTNRHPINTDFRRSGINGTGHDTWWPCKSCNGNDGLRDKGLNEVGEYTYIVGDTIMTNLHNHLFA